MTDPFRKVRSGDPLQIPAETFNTFIDTARDFKSRRQSTVREPLADQRLTDIVSIKNTSGNDLNRFEVLGLDGPLFTPCQNLLSFQNQIAFVGVTPSEDSHVGRFAILLEPLRDGMIGSACLSGVCPVRLNVLDEEHDWADIEDGETDSLKTDTAGSAYILWKETAGSGSYGYSNCGYGYGYGIGYGYGYGYYGGLPWALVRLSNLSDGDSWGTV